MTGGSTLSAGPCIGVINVVTLCAGPRDGVYTLGEWPVRCGCYAQWVAPVTPSVTLSAGCGGSLCSGRGVLLWVMLGRWRGDVLCLGRGRDGVGVFAYVYSESLTQRERKRERERDRETRG